MDALSTNRTQRLQLLVDKIAKGDTRTLDDVYDLLEWGMFGPEVFGQFGLGLSGYVFRQSPIGVRMTVKVIESGVPLVAFISCVTTTACIEQMFDLLYAHRLKWQKDRYPWI
jgi:hypothetical protein